MIFKSNNSFFMNFANPTRFSIIIALRDKPLNVTEITKKINEEQSKVSHNLKKLAHCHILNVEQKGKERIYSVNNQTVIPMLKLIEKHIANHCKECENHEI